MEKRVGGCKSGGRSNWWRRNVHAKIKGKGTRPLRNNKPFKGYERAGNTGKKVAVTCVCKGQAMRRSTRLMAYL